ncbi:hypothetical protein GCM10011490_22460 [Pseudoclavibacter endophyticus]|uniref:DUF3618 domain-containing protein n=1 Tax=Pseudoclavibacter endophyticus TaxID=1778590 RepID=A0A6H9WL89_9MICO|nr:DUF3618 domain-containing protein [Pseudoclavibacter endophyticus]KAB1648282.1 DUF3618 domain-containing protein [Pseudoclavibacter endophyticus]GGA71292.1 hypothetical protein GCM10011490_22460 [Pseudoclavibacter endophyticus]
MTDFTPRDRGVYQPGPNVPEPIYDDLNRPVGPGAGVRRDDTGANVDPDDPDAIRARIEATRSELSADVDALGDKVDPAKVAQRQGDRVKSRLTGMKDRIMGAADDARGSAGDAGDAASDAAHRVKEKAEGNPFAVGMIAFGAGLLLSSLFPASRKETELAADAREKAQPLIEGAKDVAQESAEHLKEPAQDAANAVREQATSSAESLRTDATSEAQNVRGEAEQARQNVQDEHQRGN